MKNLLAIIKSSRASWLLLLVFAISMKANAQFAIVGNGTASNTSTGYPAPFGNYYYGARHQFFVTAAQLTAAGIPANSVINSVGFNVTATNGASSHVGFTIKVYSTTLANPISGGYVTTGQVGQSAAVNWTPVTGWNQFNLTAGFVWNGTSNLVVETCFNNTGFNSNASTQWTTSGLGTATWSRWYRADNTGVCGSTTTTSTSTTTRPNIRFGYFPNTACSGTPNAGTAAISSSTGCGGATFNLTTSGLTTGSGISYQWQSGPSATGPWTNIPGATTGTYSTSTTSTTFYRLVTTCSNSGLTNATNAVSFTPTPSTCYVQFNLTDAFGDGWNGATMNFIVNGSVYATLGPTFTTGASLALNYCIPAGSSYSLVYTNGGSWPSEVGLSMTVSGSTVYSVGAGGATVGATLTTGVACPLPCSGTPNTPVASISAGSGCSGAPFTISTTGFSAGTGISYQWQSAPTATGPWTNIGGATTTSLSSSATTATFYRLVTTCSSSGLTSNSNVVSYSVNTCLGSITMTDSFGDGWNGATMTLNVNGSPFQTFGSTFTSGSSQTINFCLPSNSTYSLVYTNGGSWPGEVGVSFTVNGVNVYSVGAGGAAIGSTLNSGVACPPPCSGTPNTPTASIANSSACIGESTVITTTGFSAGSGITYQWQSGPSATGPWSNIGGATTTSYTATAAAGITFYQLVTTCVNSGLTTATNAVSLNGVTCYNVPFSGNTTVTACSGILYDHGGSLGGYGNNANGYTVITSSNPGSEIQLSGNLNSESGYDYVYIYNGVGLTGTLLWSGSGATAIPTLTSTGGSVTVQFFSDGSFTSSGFQITWICVPPAPTITGTASTICSNQGTTVDLTASGAVGTVYWFQGGCATTGQIGTGTTLSVSPNVTTTYYARNFNGGQWSSCASYTVTVNPTPTNVNAGADVAVQCPGTSVPLNGSVTSIPGALSVVISGSGFLDETSWTLTNSLGTVIGSGGSYGLGSTNTIPIGSSANGPYSLFVETQGTFSDNIANYSVICNGSTVISGIVNGGQTTTQSVASCGSNFTFAWTPSATVASPSSLVTSASPTANETYTLSVTENGCSATDQVTITVLDNINPTITAPAAVNTVADPGSCTAAGVVLGTPITADNCTVASVTNDAPSFFPIGTTIVTWTVLDGFGNSATASQTVTVVDTQNPTIIAPAAVSVNADPGLCSSSSVTLGNPSIADNCAVVSIVNNAPAIFPVGNTTVSWVITDAAGNSASADQIVTVIDNQNPTITAPSNLTVAADPGSCSATGVSLGSSIVADNCGIASVTNNAPSTFPDGPTTVTWTVTDLNGNSSTASQTVTVTDTQAPQPLCQNVFVNLDATGNATVTAAQVDNGSTDNCSIASLALSQTAFSCSNVGINAVTLTATDNAGNTSTCPAFVIVQDVTPPVAICQNVTLNLNPITGMATLTAAQVDNGSTDACGVASISVSQTNFDCANLGPNTVTLTVIDVNGNTSTCTSTVTVVDNTTPNFVTTPSNITENSIIGTCGRVITYAAPTFFDACSATLTQTDGSGLTSGDLFPVGVTNQTYTITDQSGNTTSYTFTITVIDNQLPVLLNCPSNITVSASPTSCSAVVNWSAPSGSDNCPGVSVSTTHVPGSTFPLGTTTVTYTATDASNNQTTCSFTVTVVDNTGPFVASLPTVTGQCSATVTPPVVVDNCTGNTTGITSDPLTYTAQGTYFVNWSFTDANGNTSTAVQVVIVQDNTDPIITAPAPLTVAANAACSATGLTLGTPTVSDNCSSVTLTNNAPAVYALGTTIVTWTATDAVGNTSTASQIVTVLDNTIPTITPPVNISVNTVGACDVTGVVLGTPLVNDNCGVASVTNNAPTSFPIGTTFITWTVTDNAGNTATATQSVTVVDNINPTIIAPSAVTANANASCVAYNVNLGLPVTSDNCSVASVTNNAPAVFPIGSTLVTWTVTDASGNSSTATQLVTVIDAISPAITAPIAVTVGANSGCTATGVILGNAVTSDNCSAVTITNNAPASFPLGNTTVIWTATDAAGNVSTANQLVTVIDQTNPTITAPVNLTVNAGNSCNLSGINLGFPVVADNCGVANIANDAPTTFPVGTTLVTWTIIDNAGNTATSTQTVTVVDNTAPVIVAPSNLTVDANSSCVAFNVNLGSPVASDNCTSITITNDAPNVFELGTTIVTWTVTDASGNTATASQTVTVEDNIAPEIIAPANIQVIATANCSATGVVLGNPIVSDNCSGVTTQNDAPVTFPVGSTIVTWTATDASGNSSTAQQTVTVTDDVNPTVLVQDITITLDATGAAVISFSDVDAGSFDNCGISSTVLSQSEFSCTDIGVNNIIVTVVDNSGNTTTAPVSITVQSNGIDSDFDGIDDACDTEDNEVVADVPEAFTPNGNNINDYFEIKNITTFNERKLEVFNRYGMSVYSNDQYDNTWDGTRKDNGQTLPDGTYYYVLTLDGEIKKGFVYINRVKQ